MAINQPQISYEKDPDAVLDYPFNWAPWLDTDTGEVITLSTFEVSPGITVNSSTNTTTATKIWLSGGQTNQVYTVTNRVTTSAGRTDDRSITIRVRNR